MHKVSVVVAVADDQGGPQDKHIDLIFPNPIDLNDLQQRLVREIIFLAQDFGVLKGVVIP